VSIPLSVCKPQQERLGFGDDSGEEGQTQSDRIRESWLTVSEVCMRLNITERHLRSLVFRDEIPVHRVGRLLRFEWPEVELWTRIKPLVADPLIETRTPSSAVQRKCSPESDNADRRRAAREAWSEGSGR
jgi:excisionase family DNA binding protein